MGGESLRSGLPPTGRLVVALTNNDSHHTLNLLLRRLRLANQAQKSVNSIAGAHACKSCTGKLLVLKVLWIPITKAAKHSLESDEYTDELKSLHCLLDWLTHSFCGSA
nr:hypothetical protein Iba_chr13dCG10100 [Ipomoea batatas]